MGRKIFVKGHLLVPFGCEKWKIDDIGVAGVGTSGTYFECGTPVAYIDTTAKKPLRLTRIRNLFPEDLPSGIDDASEALRVIADWLASKTQIQTGSEQRFLKLYFEYLQEAVSQENFFAPSDATPDWAFEGLMPLPQAHLYLEDPLSDEWSYVPTRMVKVDFAFWTGTEFVAVEIDGSSHVGDPNHIKRDRMLQRSGVHVVHIVNEELLEHGTKVIERLLPSALTRFYEGMNPKRATNPMKYKIVDDERVSF